MTEVMRKAYTEVNEILKMLPKEYVQKVPIKLRDMFEKTRINDYKVDLNPNKSIKEQNVVYETRVILTILKLNYWCESEEEKRRLKEKLINNNKKLQEKYDMFS